MKIKKNNFLFLTFFLIFFLIISPLPINKIEQIQIKNSYGLSTKPLEKITKKYINKNIFLSLIDLNLQDLTKKIPSIDTYKLNLVYPHKIIIKVIVILAIVFGILVLVSKINFPSPNQLIEKKIPQENLKIVK